MYSTNYGTHVVFLKDISFAVINRFKDYGIITNDIFSLTVMFLI